MNHQAEHGLNLVAQTSEPSGTAFAKSGSVPQGWDVLPKWAEPGTEGDEIEVTPGLHFQSAQASLLCSLNTYYALRPELGL